MDWEISNGFEQVVSLRAALWSFNPLQWVAVLVLWPSCSTQTRRNRSKTITFNGCPVQVPKPPTGKNWQKLAKIIGHLRLDALAVHPSSRPSPHPKASAQAHAPLQRLRDSPGARLRVGRQPGAQVLAPRPRRLHLKTKSTGTCKTKERERERGTLFAVQK